MLLKYLHRKNLIFDMEQAIEYDSGCELWNISYRIESEIQYAIEY